MGTHPIFESDFDCLTEIQKCHRTQIRIMTAQEVKVKAQSQVSIRPKKQVDEVVVIMKQNVDKVLERDSKLTELDTRADALQAGAAQFETNATSLQRKFWWQNMKMNLIIGGVIVIVIVIIIFATTLPKKGGDDGDS